MQSSLKVRKYRTNKGINIISINTDKFKTNSINLFIHNGLDKKTVTQNALIPMVLKRGSSEYPTMQEISKKLENLYGSFFDCGIVKKGERQIQHFYIDGVNEKYLRTGESLFDSCAQLLNSIATKPLIQNNKFRDEYVQQEKENLAKLIQARKNDKVQYAVERCYELMCAGERYGIHEWGNIDDLQNINAEGLYKTYLDNLKRSRIDIIVLGNVNDEWIAGLQDIIDINTDASKTIEKEQTQKAVAEVRTYIDEMDVNQGKLSMGFRTNTSPDSTDYYDLLVYNSVLGGGVHSKLFQNVREKASLAYYAFSRLDKLKGTMMIGSGIEADKYEQTKEIIFEQIKDVEAGKISDFEFDSSIKSLENGFRNLADEPLQLVDFCLGQSITGSNDDVETIINKIKSVKRDDIVKVANKVKLDTIHFIKPREGR